MNSVEVDETAVSIPEVKVVGFVVDGGLVAVSVEVRSVTKVEGSAVAGLVVVGGLVLGLKVGAKRVG